MSAIRFILILIVVFAIALFALRPELISDVWLWITGLIGLIIKLFERVWKFITHQFAADVQPSVSPQVNKAQSLSPKINNAVPTARNETTVEDFKDHEFSGTTLELQRFKEDSDSTLGTLHINGEFFCYTLEDAYHQEKIKGKTRIPAGTYTIDFNRVETNMTKRYRNSDYSSEWFIYHLHLKNVPGFEGIYIHNGGTHEDTKGCILVSKEYNDRVEPITLTRSRETFKELYIRLKQQIDNGVKIQIIIRNKQDIQ